MVRLPFNLKYLVAQYINCVYPTDVDVIIRNYKYLIRTAIKQDKLGVSAYLVKCSNY